MKNKGYIKSVTAVISSFLLLTLLITGSTFASGNVLFDAAHAQKAGSADWVIDGGFSDFADELENAGFQINAIEYGEISAAVLKDFDVLVIPEPNDPFSRYEETVIKDYVKNGGGLFLVGDHKGADRNNNGWDAVDIFNRFVPEFGFRFVEHTFSEHPMRGKRYDHPVVEGVYDVGGWGCTTMEVINNNMKGLIYSGYKGTPYIVAGDYGKGRIVVVGDSSPLDDGTKASGSTSGLHDNYNMSEYDHHRFSVNAVKWLNKEFSKDNE